jgi:hypothetical protein
VQRKDAYTPGDNSIDNNIFNDRPAESTRLKFQRRPHSAILSARAKGEAREGRGEGREGRGEGREGRDDGREGRGEGREGRQGRGGEGGRAEILTGGLVDPRPLPAHRKGTHNSTAGTAAAAAAITAAAAAAAKEKHANLSRKFHDHRDWERNRDREREGHASEQQQEIYRAQRRQRDGMGSNGVNNRGLFFDDLDTPAPVPAPAPGTAPGTAPGHQALPRNVSPILGGNERGDSRENRRQAGERGKHITDVSSHNGNGAAQKSKSNHPAFNIITGGMF